MSQQFERLEPDEVLSVEADIKRKISSIPNTTFQVKEFWQNLLKPRGSREDLLKAFTSEGIDCRVLKLTGGWVKGKVKLTLEFYPDEAEIPQQSQAGKNNPDSLDDLRRELNQ